MQLSFAIQHHPSRAALLERLATLSAEVVTDPDPLGARSPWRTYREALIRTPANATHRVVIQDDAVLCENFVELAEAAVRECPCRVLCLFVSRQAVRAALVMTEMARRQESFVRIGDDHFLPCVAVAWPAQAARDLVAWSDRQRFGKTTADDAITMSGIKALGLEVWATIPSLVDHRDDVPSLMASRVGQKRRRAVLPHPSLV